MYVTQGLHRATQIKPDGVATVFGDRRRTWTELQDRVARLAGALVAAGLQPGGRVAPIAMNSDRYVEMYYAVWWAGGVIVPGNIRWTPAEHVYAIDDCGAELLIVDETFASLAKPLAEACSPRRVFYFDDGRAPDGTVDLEAVMEQTAPIADACGRDDELAALFYTGGTTGRSKGVMLSHRNLTATYLCALVTMRGRENQIFLHSPPMFHIGDASMMIAVTMMAGTHVIIPSFTPAAMVAAVAKERVTDFLLVPTMLAMLCDYVDRNPVDLSSVVFVGYGAGPSSETLKRRIMDMLPGVDLVHGYGQTETACFATFLPAELHKVAIDGDSYHLRSVGRALVGFDVRIVDDEMNEQPRGVAGEILVRGPSTMLGYWKQPELTARTIVDGWVRTGDAGHMDHNGFVFLGDRLKDIIVTGAENVYSVEVEDALSAHTAVVECAVIGVPDQKWGERVHAVVRLAPGVNVSSGDLIDFCRTRIARYKCPRSIEFRTDPLPLSAAGKVLKNELRKLHTS